jgi:hypothetical protein
MMLSILTLCVVLARRRYMRRQEVRADNRLARKETLELKAAGYKVWTEP